MLAKILPPPTQLIVSFPEQQLQLALDGLLKWLKQATPIAYYPCVHLSFVV